MMETLEAGVTGFGTYKLSGVGGFTDTTLIAALGLTALPANVKGADILNNNSTADVYYENDGSAADANATPIPNGSSLRIRNSRELMGVIHLFATVAAYDIRVTLWG